MTPISTSKTPKQRRPLVIACLLTVLMAFTPPASADPFGVGPTDAGWLADNHDHDYCWSTGFNWTTLQNKARRSMEYLESSTDFDGGSLESCSSGTDIYFERYNTTEYRGQYECFDRGGGNRCDRAYVRISSNRSTLPTDQRRKTICHEIGHTTGATHHDVDWGCMLSGSSTAETYVAHTRDHMDELSVSNS
ncbi:MAG: hypothetical protein OXH78_07975 [Acidimicrobiaceae bacterium]|nr:hypothetical protein [Acidimicrobiaceae bacterium]